MRISGLIKKLLEQKKEEGDIPVVFMDVDGRIIPVEGVASASAGPESRCILSEEE